MLHKSMIAMKQKNGFPLYNSDRKVNCIKHTFIQVIYQMKLLILKNGSFSSLGKW